MRISIDGNIGAGKTFYLKKLEEDGYIVHHEDTKKWSQWLQKYNGNMKRYAMGFQLQILLDQINMPYVEKRLNLYERSPYTLKNVFGDLLAEEDLFDQDECKIHNEYIEKFGWKPDIIIYLYCDPNECFDRINNRKYVDGDHKLKQSYITDIHLKHETVFDDLNCSIPIYKVNSQEDQSTVYANIVEILKKESNKRIKRQIK